MVEFESTRKPASVPQTAGQLEKDDEDELDEQPYTFETKRTFELLGEQESTLDRELNLARQFREEHLAHWDRAPQTPHDCCIEEASVCRMEK